MKNTYHVIHLYKFLEQAEQVYGFKAKQLPLKVFSGETDGKGCEGIFCSYVNFLYVGSGLGYPFKFSKCTKWHT